MKKTITLTDDQALVVNVAIGMHIKMLNEFLQSAREREEKDIMPLYEKDIAALEQVQATIREAKWEF